jgi:hypothetical protein
MRPSEKLSLINLHILKGLRLQTEREEMGQKKGKGTKGGGKRKKRMKIREIWLQMGKEEKGGE